MTREEFDGHLNNDTVLGFTADRAKYKTLRALAAGFKRPDVVAIFDGLIQALDVAIIEADKLGVTPTAEEQLS